MKMRRIETTLKGYYTRKELMDALRIKSAKTVQNWMDNGRIKFIKIGGALFFEESEVVRMSEERPKRGFARKDREEANDGNQ